MPEEGADVLVANGPLHGHRKLIAVTSTGEEAVASLKGREGVCEMRSNRWTEVTARVHEHVLEHLLDDMRRDYGVTITECWLGQRRSA